MTYTPLSPDEIKIAVLHEAEKQFIKYGIAKTQMNKIAETVGIGRSTLYRYYPEKDNLAFHVTWRIIDRITSQALKKAHEIKTATGFEQLTIFFESYIELLKSNIKILIYFTEYDRLFEGIYPDSAETKEFVKTINRFTVLISQFIDKGLGDKSVVTDEEPIVLATVLLNAIVGTSQRVLPRSRHYNIEHGTSGEIIVNRVLTLLLHSIKA